MNLLVTALVTKLDLQRHLNPKLTTKELQTAKPESLTQNGDYLEAAHQVFLEMKRGHYKGIHPDTFTCSQLLRGLKAVSRQQQMTGNSISGANHPSYTRLQTYMGTLQSHFSFLLAR